MGVVVVVMKTLGAIFRNAVAFVVAMVLMFMTAGVSTSAEAIRSSGNQEVSTVVSDTDVFLISDEEISRYVGDIDDTGSSVQRMTYATGFVARINVDNAHESGPYASGHAWWTLISGTKTKMQVRASLRVPVLWIGYSTKARSKVVSVWPGGGAGHRATAKYKCNGKKVTKWYTYGEIFAPGKQKAYGTYKGKVKDLACGV